MERLHFEDDEPTGDPVCDFDFDFELFSLKIPEYKELIYEEIKLYHGTEATEEYAALKKSHPAGHLYTRYPKERLRTMYKQDPTILAIYNKTAGASDDKSTKADSTATPASAAAATSS